MMHYQSISKAWLQKMQQAASDAETNVQCHCCSHDIAVKQYPTRFQAQTPQPEPSRIDPVHKHITAQHTNVCGGWLGDNDPVRDKVTLYLQPPRGRRRKVERRVERRERGNNVTASKAGIMPSNSKRRRRQQLHTGNRTKEHRYLEGGKGLRLSPKQG